MKDVLIKVRGTQIGGTDTLPIELITEGTLRVLPDGIALNYQESQTIKGGRINTCLTVMNNNTVILERSGDLNSKFIITEGMRRNCFYSIPQGSLALGIYGRKVENGLSENGGTLKMVYTIDANMQRLSDNTIEIVVEERK